MNNKDKTYIRQQIVSKINKARKELNSLLERAAPYGIRFDCNFNTGHDYGKGRVTHLAIKAYKEISSEG